MLSNKQKLPEMKNKITILILFIFSVIPEIVRGANVADADSAYNAKEYAKAISIYNELIEENGTSAPVLFNLGSAYYQAGDYGQAMLNYLRARRLDPGNEEINANLRYLQSRVEDANKAEQKGKHLKAGTDEPSFFQSVHASVAKDISSDTWGVWGAVCFICFLGCVALYIFSRVVLARKTGFFGGLIFLAMSFVFVMFAFMGVRAYHSSSEGVLTAFKTTLLTEPGKEAAEGKELVLTRGTQVQILSEEADAEGNVTWYKIRLNSDYIGWVAASDLEII